MTDIDLLIRDFRSDQPGPVAAPAAVAVAARTARGPRRRMVRRRLLAGAAVTATIAGAAVFLVLLLPGGGDPAPATPSAGYAARATVRVTPLNGASQDAVTNRAVEIIRARAAAQGLTGAVVERSADATVSLTIPGVAGAERIALLTENPGLRVVDLTGKRDPATAPVVVGPADITDLTFSGGIYRIGVRDRTATALSSVLARRRDLALLGASGTGRDLLGQIDVDRSAAMSSSAILAMPPTWAAQGSAAHAAQTLAGGGVDADFSVEDVRTVGDPPAGVSEVPLDVARALNLGTAAGAAAPMLPGSVRQVLSGAMEGRDVSQWEGETVAGDRRSFIVVPGGGGESAGCAVSPAPKVPAAAVRPCAYVPGGDVAAVFGLADVGVDRVEVRFRGTSRIALLRDGRFLSLLPTDVTEVTIVAVDAAGRELDRLTTGLGSDRGAVVSRP